LAFGTFVSDGPLIGDWEGLLVAGGEAHRDPDAEEALAGGKIVGVGAHNEWQITRPGGYCLRLVRAHRERPRDRPVDAAATSC